MLIRRGTKRHPADWIPRRRRVALALALLALGTQPSCRKHPPTARDLSVMLTADVSADPPRITLRWVANPRDATQIDVYRKSPADPSFNAPIAPSLPPSTTTYTDTGVKRGIVYEYYVERTHPGDPWQSAGYLCSGIEVPLKEDRGDFALVIESGLLGTLSPEIASFEEDLTGDGWVTSRVVVPKTATPPEVKAKIKALYDAAPDRLKQVFLIGHIAVPYSGNLVPDGHSEPAHGPVHYGAWPADIYYGDMRSEWTDTTVDTNKNPYPPSDPANSNVPGDGKFDQNFARVGWRKVRLGARRLAPEPQGAVDIAVGRVDLSDMPTFLPRTEVDLLRAYFDKDHRFRHKLLTGEAKGLIHDVVGYLSTKSDWIPSQAQASSAFAGTSAIFGPAAVEVGPWLTRLEKRRVLFAYGGGYGLQTSCEGVATTDDLAHKDPKAIFTIVFGSYFGDWNHTDNFLRAQIATSSGLAAGWGMPQWFLQPLGIGETVGDCLRLTQNAVPFIHLALMGDPSLRMLVVAPPSAAVATASPDGVTLRWKASPEAVLGYHVYQEASPGKPLERLTDKLLPGTELTVTGPARGGARYLVRAVKLETTPSGSFFNASQGAFAAAPPPSPPLSAPALPASGKAPLRVAPIAAKATAKP